MRCVGVGDLGRDSNFIQIEGHHYYCRSKQLRSEGPFRKIQYLPDLDGGQLKAGPSARVILREGPEARQRPVLAGGPRG